MPGVKFQRGQRAASIGLQSWDDETLSFEGVLASETPCRSYRFSPDGYDIVDVNEVLSMEGIRSVDQLVGAPLLNMHSSYSLQSVVGVIEAARVEGKQLIIRARMWDRPDLEDVIDGVRKGILKNLSVGFDRFEETYEERDGKCPLVTVTSWQPAEGSLVAVPADATAQIRAAAGAKPKPSGSRRKPASTSTRTATMATRKQRAAVEEAEDRLERARAALEAARKKAGLSPRGRREDDEQDEERDADEQDGEREDEDQDGERDGDEDDADQRGRAGRRSRRAKRDDDEERDGDEDGDADDADDERSRRAAVIRGLRAVAQRRGKESLADFDAVRAAGGSVADLKDVAMGAVRSRSAGVTSTHGARGGGEKPSLRSFSETAIAQRKR
ncbi:HK97 family phage prohead protease [Methylobacterium sp. MA0201]|uniref:HK97 family phage prohead protease n=1 Tax=Methylobacterium alsaeris TaxID=3344826 RepID=UPI0037582680